MVSGGNWDKIKDLQNDRSIEVNSMMLKLEDNPQPLSDGQ